MDDDDETPVLSGSALDALKEFYADRDARQKQFEDLKAGAEADAALSMETFAEDWNQSQFWYSDETAAVLAEQLLRGADRSTTIAAVSAPSVFIQLKNLLAKSGKADDEKPKLYLLEFDERFNVFPEFVFYDFKTPLKLPAQMRGTVDHIICDPPFLSEECQTKAAMTVRWLSKWSTAEKSLEAEQRAASRLIVCTGERMEKVVTKLYRPQGLTTTTFEPVHRNGLSNEFFCYANFECEQWKWRP
ncbi:protein-lysine N-methyltransferase EFM5 [Coleophoma crateriformis]|uniref:Protein-lysine N-methyltransferase EFM5 n=1 Tax=Coleophoma crateriformis TaxID=565419 RepID=A0A3D8RIS1_9HELO|nr:protein-lysine N-methyltransferase EFM5 [Coleophoma crateriformis]